MKTYVVLVALALLVGFGVASWHARSERLGPAPQFSLESLAGTVVSLDDFLGRVVVLDFWASWCGPCTSTFPDLQALAARHAGQGLVLLVVDLDRRPESARAYMDKHGFPAESVLYGSLDAARAVKALYRVGGIPHTVLIDREGQIRYSGHPARMGEEDLAPWL